MVMFTVSRWWLAKAMLKGSSGIRPAPGPGVGVGIGVGCLEPQAARINAHKTKQPNVQTACLVSIFMTVLLGLVTHYRPGA